MNVSRKPRVLCVDDEPGVLRSLGWLLCSRFDVSSASDAIEGLELVRRGAFDVVICDQRMPGMTGTEFLRRVKETSPNTMRLLLTGHQEYTDVLHSVNDSEVFRFIQKPWDNQLLVDTVSYAAKVAREVPLQPRADPPLDRDPALDQRRSGRTEAVLLMDEDPAIERQLRSIVGDTRLLLWARNPGEAVTLLHRHKVAVIVADTHSGGGSTLDLIRVVKRGSPNIVAVVYTTERDSSTISRLINEGQIFRFIAKPAGPGCVARMIGAALKKHRALMAQPARVARHAVELSRSPAFELAGEGQRTRHSAHLTASEPSRFDTSLAWLLRLFGKS